MRAYIIGETVIATHDDTQGVPASAYGESATVLSVPATIRPGMTISDLHDTDLASFKTLLKSQVDEDAEAERKKYITPGEGQAMTYQRKVEEAKRAVLEEEPAASDYPMLAASIDVDGATVKEVAAIVLQMDAAWAVVGSEIENIRLTAKKAIDAATDIETASAVVNALNWPERSS